MSRTQRMGILLVVAALLLPVGSFGFVVSRPDVGLSWAIQQGVIQLLGPSLYDIGLEKVLPINLVVPYRYVLAFSCLLILVGMCMALFGPKREDRDPIPTPSSDPSPVAHEARLVHESGQDKGGGEEFTTQRDTESLVDTGVSSGLSEERKRVGEESEKAVHFSTVRAVPPVYDPSDYQIRPWVRYTARILDTYLFAIFAGSILFIVYPPYIEFNDLLLGLAVVFGYVFVEPVMLAKWGTTPGKALLKVRLRRADGSKLSYMDGLSRCFDLWAGGLGFGIPFIAVVTFLVAYRRLKKNGLTSWDENGNFKVRHQIIGPLRVILAIIAFIGMFLLIAVGEA